MTRPVRSDAIPFVLSPADYTLALESATRRRVDSQQRGLVEQHGARRGDGRGFHRDLTGTLAELAVARWAGMSSSWAPSLGTFKAADLILPNGLPVQVRGRSEFWPDGVGIIRKDDAPGQRWVFVVLSSPASDHGQFMGWMWTSEAWRREWVKAIGGRPPAWFVPAAAEALKPLATLLEVRI